MEGAAKAMGKLDERLTKQENALKVNAEVISSIRQELLYFTRTVQKIQTADFSPAPQLLTDDCEVLLSGLPIESNLSDSAILDKTLSNIGLPQHTRFITRTRNWSPKNQRKNSNCGHTRSLVFQCSSPVVRDTIVSHLLVVQPYTFVYVCVCVCYNISPKSTIFTLASFSPTEYELCQLVPCILLLMSRAGGFECRHCTRTIATVSLICSCGLAFHPGCLGRYLATSALTDCCSALLSGTSVSGADIRRGRRAKDIALTQLQSRSTSVDARRYIDEGHTAAEHSKTQDTCPPSTMSVSNESILEAILRIEAGVSEVRATCTELRAGAVAMDAKLDRAIATLETHNDRISAVEDRQREIMDYLKKMKPCTGIKIVGIPDALSDSSDAGTRKLCVDVLKLIGAEDTTITRDRVLNMKRKAGEILASALLPGASGVLRIYEMRSSFTHNLLIKTKEVAKARGYAHVWVRDGLVCVRKSDGLEVIEVLTEMDLKMPYEINFSSPWIFCQPFSGVLQYHPRRPIASSSKHALSRPLRKRLVESMIFATFDYGSSVFYDLNKEQSLQLHRLHNACVRFVCMERYRTELMSPRIVWHWLWLTRGWIKLHKPSSNKVLLYCRTLALLLNWTSVCGELNELRRRQNESSEMLSELQRRMTVFASTSRDAELPPICPTPTVDSCEVRVTGIPASVSAPDITTTERILKALQLERLTPHVISVRPWTAGRAVHRTPHLPRLPLECAQMPVVRER
ncbi:unnamed protein product [Trichogramma brassicae]|uniref:FP protein C-terminal domain-containing protein n=1 Tax=Trichogramma brassicae TaxID=86971 RepID=A0A6H5ITM1_9HYME|nr:unnamed protein product [Trichogramma brassicae]